MTWDADVVEVKLSLKELSLLNLAISVAVERGKSACGGATRHNDLHLLNQKVRKKLYWELGQRSKSADS